MSSMGKDVAGFWCPPPFFFVVSGEGDDEVVGVEVAGVVEVEDLAARLMNCTDMGISRLGSGRLRRFFAVRSVTVCIVAMNRTAQ